MKKNFIYIMSAVVVLGGVVWFSTRPNTKDLTQTPSQTKSFNDVLKGSGSYKCSITQNVSNIESTGTVYVVASNDMTAQKIKGEFTTKVQGMSVDTSFVMKEGFSYSWSSMMPQTGYKVKVQEQTGDTTTSTSGTYSFNASQIGSYNCEDWKADNKMFDLPSSVKFMDIPQATNTAVPVTSVTAPVPTTPTTPTLPATTPQATPVSSGPKTFTMAEVSTHTTDKSCYTTINGNVYDVTSYIPRHPGGASKILKICGKDGSSLFEDQHGGQTKPEQLLASFKIGVLSN